MVIQETNCAPCFYIREEENDLSYIHVGLFEISYNFPGGRTKETLMKLHNKITMEDCHSLLNTLKGLKEQEFIHKYELDKLDVYPNANLHYRVWCYLYEKSNKEIYEILNDYFYKLTPMVRPSGMLWDKWIDVSEKCRTSDRSS